MRARIEPAADGGEDIDIPIPAMAPAYRVGVQQQRRARAGGGMDPATRRLAIFAGGIGATLVMLIGVWSFSGHHHAGIPVIEADSHPVRVRPANPGGMQVAGANDSILSGESDDKVAMAPPPEAPAPQALKAGEKPPQAVAPPRSAAPLPAAPESPMPVPVTAPTVQPTPQPTPQPTARPAPRAVTALPPPTPLMPAASPPQTAPAVARGSGALVQLAAVESESEDAARAEWKRLARRYRDLLEGRTPSFSRTEHGGKVFWRVRTGGFSDVEEAVKFCDRVRAKGGGCSVAGF